MATATIMSTYIFGDIQGCYDELLALLEQVHFEPDVDRLWFAGDLINRGPKNLETMQFIMGLNDPIVVLGNHDLHFLAVAMGAQDVMPTDTIADILDSQQSSQIVDFIRAQKLAHHDPASGFTMVHAGIPPFWDLPTLLRRANEVESVLSGTAFERFLTDMYGNEPSKWKDELTGNTRLRVITNYLTRLRYCDTDGTLELKHKASKRPQGFEPWFNIQRTTAMKIVFGHWAALDGVTNQPNIVALDTGCVWGRKLTAMRLEDRQIFSTPARKTYQL